MKQSLCQSSTPSTAFINEPKKTNCLPHFRAKKTSATKSSIYPNIIMTWEWSTWHFCLHWAPCGRLSPLWRCPWCHPARPVPTSTTSALRNHRVAGVLCRWVAAERSLHATPVNSILQSGLDSWDIYIYYIP